MISFWFLKSSLLFSLTSSHTRFRDSLFFFPPFPLNPAQTGLCPEPPGIVCWENSFHFHNFLWLSSPPWGQSFKMLAERRLSSDIRYLHAHGNVLSVLTIRSPAGEPNHCTVVTQECYICISGLIHDAFIIAWHWKGAGGSRRELSQELCRRDTPLVDDLPLCLFASCLRWSSLRCSLHSPIMLSCLVMVPERLDNWPRNKISEAVNQAMLFFPSGVSSAILSRWWKV